MSFEKRIKAFEELGSFLKQFAKNRKDELLASLNDKYYDDFDRLIQNQQLYNGWFTTDNVLQSVNAIAVTLTSEKLTLWLSSYQLIEKSPKRIGVVMAGNIPLVGFHDFLTVLITGNVLIAKTAKQDQLLIKKIASILIFIEPAFVDKIEFTERLNNFDAVIATGSNNTARYFEYYFGKYPHIIRKNRNSVAIISGKETIQEMKALGNDIFQYFGLGCRNVSKIYVPINYNFNEFFEAIVNDFKHVTDNNKYANNYDYNKAVYLLGNNQLLDNNFVMLKEDQSLTSPVGVVYYEFYNSIEEVVEKIQERAHEIQCVVSSSENIPNSLNFGEAQQPQLWDYADGIDTVDFLLKL